MSTVRQDLATLLAQTLPASWRIIDHADSLDRIDPGRPVLMLWREAVTPSQVGTSRLIDNQMRAWLLTPRADPGPADDDLDTMLDTLIAAIDRITATTWDRAERGVWQDIYAGYQTTITYTTEKKEYLP